MNVLVSACLLGLKCRYDGNDNKSNELLKVISIGYNLIPVCPEQLGGLSTPRKPAEIIEGRVINIDNGQVTQLCKGFFQCLLHPDTQRDHDGDCAGTDDNAADGQSCTHLTAQQVLHAHGNQIRDLHRRIRSSWP